MFNNCDVPQSLHRTAPGRLDVGIKVIGSQRWYVNTFQLLAKLLFFLFRGIYREFDKYVEQ